MAESKATNVIQSLQVGCDLLELIASNGKPLKYNEIYQLSQMTKSNLHKYLHTLTLVGLLYRDKGSGMYTLGSKLIEYGLKAVNQENVVERVMPFLQEINQVCKNTVLLTSWSQNGPMVVRLINAQDGLNIGAQLGTVLPSMSAAGKIFSAFQEENVLAEWKAEELRRMDEDQQALYEHEIQTVRTHGLALASEPLVPSISSIAFPIFNFDARLLGVVVVVGFSNTIANKLDDMMSQYLIKMRNEVCEAFGYNMKRKLQ